MTEKAILHTHTHTHTPLFCSHADKILIDSRNSIYQCKDCGLYMAENFSFRSPSNPSAEEAMMDSIETLRRGNYREILTRIRRLLGDGKICGLDVGCARGWFIDEAAKLGISMDGIEPEENFCLEAQGHGFNVINGLFPQDFNASRQYDFIIFNDVFEHLPDLDSVLRECAGLLKPEGLLIINCPDSSGIFFRLARTLMRFGIDSYWRRLWQTDFYSPHLWYFGKKNLTRLIEGYGFSLADISAPKTITVKGLRKRIMCGAGNVISQFATYLAVLAASPFLNLLPKDIMCLYFRKIKKEEKL